MYDGLKNLVLLKYLPELGKNPSAGLLFVFGVLTSVHCACMCGGIVISQSIKSEDKRFSLSAILYNLGRIISYTTIGGIVGGLGQIISFNGVLKGIVPVVAGIFMIIMSINLLGIFSFLRRLNFTIPSVVAKKIFNGNSYSPIVIGLLSGLMPCGPLQMIQLYALSTKSFIYGAIGAFIFSIGTVPLLIILGTVAGAHTIFIKKFSKITLKFSAMIILVLGVVMISRGITIEGIDFSSNKVVMNEDTVFAVVRSDKQEVETKLKPDAFPPIVVVKNIPVKWDMVVSKEDLNECNNEIQVTKFGVKKKFLVGHNIMKFTPKETGEYMFTCYMGMIKSKITVVNDIKELENLKRNTN
ncbi:Sulfite exporter TauE/SafE [Clostridium acidisoli DSM 12555]|uniref:Sulfite exporter TauE/SafE n=1 Tax=Clostridium acidisoli DSM 12555 TaxID=1121291 RepID=A0A1W1XNQ5_9CLOT|nr:sulfite exporter TauE/SafE family protein [Clostridium acidisoli]SMC25148.1 Sulfite exporter TauE/SafE [Clostridium acidisoli DSM 12555]